MSLQNQRMKCKILQTYLTVLHMYETVSLKGVRKKGADLSNVRNSWSLKDQRQKELYNKH